MRRLLSVVLACMPTLGTAALAQERYSYDVMADDPRLRWQMSVVFFSDKALVRLPGLLQVMGCSKEGLVIPKGRGEQRVFRHESMPSGTWSEIMASYTQDGGGHHLKIAEETASKSTVWEASFRLGGGCEVAFRHGYSLTRDPPDAREQPRQCLRLPLAAFEASKDNFWCKSF